MKLDASAIAALRATAEAISAEAEEHRRAIDEERTAEAELLEVIIANALPALRAIASRLLKYSESGAPDELDEYFEEAGLILENRGGVEMLAVLSDGRLAHLVDLAGDEGPVNRSLRIVSAREAMNTFELQTCIETLQTALEKQRGKRKPKAEAARKRAAQLRKLAAETRPASDDLPVSRQR